MEYDGKPVLPTKNAMDELSDIDLDLYDAVCILNDGFEIRKRSRNVIERCMQTGNKVINVVVVDLGSHYKLIHAGEFTLSRKFKRMMKDGI
ncbi:MAG: hypothetical protein Q8O89_08335 [Nanoarchaeota archaeon]|nr:hypothetical protein [Nanoarchaeota archaeon]